MKTIEMTGSPKEAGFKTKDSFLSKLAPYGYQKGKMKKTNNSVDILVTNDLESDTSKMTLAKELGVHITTYEELAELFELEKDD